MSASPYGWPIGCQTFPYGKAIDQDFPGTMKMLSYAGIQSIELCSPWYSEHNFGFRSLNKITGAEFTRVLSDHNLRCISSHVDMSELTPGSCCRPSAARKSGGSRRSWSPASTARADREGEHRLGEDIPRRQDRRRAELFHRDE